MIKFLTLRTNYHWLFFLDWLYCIDDLLLDYWALLNSFILLSYLLDLLAYFILKLSLLKFSLFNLVFVGNFSFKILEELIDLVFTLFMLLFQFPLLDHQLLILVESLEHTTYKFELPKTVSSIVHRDKLLLLLDKFSFFPISFNLSRLSKPNTKKPCFKRKLNKFCNSDFWMLQIFSVVSQFIKRFLLRLSKVSSIGALVRSCQSFQYELLAL